MRTEDMLEVSDQPQDDQQFREEMQEADVNIRDDETVMEFIHRFGFPFSLHPTGERHDN